jgi:hypothetical protein
MVEVTAEEYELLEQQADHDLRTVEDQCHFYLRAELERARTLMGLGGMVPPLVGPWPHEH